MNRINWLAATVWTAIFAALVAVLGLLAWVIEQAIKAHGQWIVNHIDWIFAGVVIVGVSMIWRWAKKDNPTW